MPASRTIEVKASGLFTHPNRLRLPPGALRIAENVTIDRDGIISRRRGLNRFGDELSAPALALFQYLNRVIVLDATTLKYDTDGDGTWGSWAGTFSPPDDVPMQALESNLNFYFLTSLGPYVQDSLTGTPVRAGVPQGLDMQLSMTGVGGSWLVPPTTVGYVLTWTRKDANRNEKQGTPSPQVRISNSFTTLLAWTRVTTTATVTHASHGYTTGDVIIVSASSDTAAIVNGEKTITVTGASSYTFACLDAGAASGTISVAKAGDVAFTATVPDDIVVGDTWELWRTDLAAAAGDPVGEDYRLIMSGILTTAQKTAGVITGTDTFDETFLGEPLYTNAGEDTKSLGHDRPPLAKFIFQFDGHTFYANAIQPRRGELQLIEVAGLVDNTSSITLTQDGATTLTYTFSSAEDQAQRRFKRFTSFTTLAENVEATAQSLVKIINRDTGNDTFVAYYISSETDAPGRVLIESKLLGDAVIYVTCNNATTSVKFSPIIPTSGTAYPIEAEEHVHRVYRSIFGQPEAVPRLSFHELGRQNKAILGGVALNKVALIAKEDGFFILSGSSDGVGGAQFVEEELDPTAHLTVPATLRLMNNSAVGFTQQGLLQAGQGQPAILSRPQVETDLLKISSFQLFSEIAHAGVYESEHKYLLAVPETQADDTPTIIYVYDYSLGGWVIWRKPVTALMVLESDNKLYAAHALDPYILQERKARDGSGGDYIDEEIPATITAVSTTTHPVTGRTVSLVTLTYDYSEALAQGFLLVQGAKRAPIDVVTSLGGTSYQVTCRYRYNFNVATCTVGLPIPMLVEWAPITLGDGLSMKQASFATLKFEKSGGTHEMAFQSDLMQERESIDVIYQDASKGWGIGPWGGFPWGDSAPGRNDALRTFIPRDHQQCRALAVRYENRYAKEKIDILQLSLDVRAFSTQSQRTPT